MSQNQGRNHSLRNPSKNRKHSKLLLPTWPITTDAFHLGEKPQQTVTDDEPKAEETHLYSAQ